MNRCAHNKWKPVIDFGINDRQTIIGIHVHEKEKTDKTIPVISERTPYNFNS
jgi:hypothetical protein